MTNNIDIVDWSTGQIFRTGQNPSEARSWIEENDWTLVEEQTDVYPGDEDVADLEIVTYYIEPNSDQAANNLRPQY